jgi:predicted nucleic acid-binding protein
LPSAETVLCDTGPFVSLIDSNDSSYAKCRVEFGRFSGTLTTTWPVLSETLYLLTKQHLRELLWQFIFNGGVDIVGPLTGDLPRIRALMAQYADLPMDFADASLVVAAERLNLRRVFTLDRRDFLLYRPRNVAAFDVFP